ncbi:MAG: HAD family phosphatase [Proteobacteria bacterium]|nr:MAG: HAD family phosphatase [Pseudomonadota bacterium]
MTDAANRIYLIFDMDGTLIDSNPTHKEAYTQFFAHHGIEISDDDFTQHISGRINAEIMTFFFGEKDKKLTDSRIKELIAEKETLFQQLYAPKIEPLPGLIEFLMAVKAADIPMALATSAPIMNVDFVFDKLGIRQFFQQVITDGDVPEGKPDPAVFRIAAERLGADPAQCIVFEDSAKGVESAKNAKMAVIALATSHEPEATEKADLVIDEYTQIKVDQLSGMLT